MTGRCGTVCTTQLTRDFDLRRHAQSKKALLDQGDCQPTEAEPASGPHPQTQAAYAEPSAPGGDGLFGSHVDGADETTVASAAPDASGRAAGDEGTPSAASDDTKVQLAAGSGGGGGGISGAWILTLLLVNVAAISTLEFRRRKALERKLVQFRRSVEEEFRQYRDKELVRESVRNAALFGGEAELRRGRDPPIRGVEGDKELYDAAAMFGSEGGSPESRRPSYDIKDGRLVRSDIV